MTDDSNRTRTARTDTSVSDDASGAPHPATSYIGRYPVDREIGRGGMGIVYRARDPQLERLLAIKIVQPPPGRTWTDTRLLREARALAKLRHPNVISIFDVGFLGDAIYLVMPLVSGGTLRDWLRAAPRPWQEVTARFLAAGRGLAAAHAAGLVHRDFKPQNVLLDADAHVFVADFGLVAEEPPAGARALIDTSVKGTPAYMAPEQAAGKNVDARADQYSFCVSFWEALRGRRPSEEETRDQLAPRPAPHTGASGSGHAPDWLLTVIARGLAFSPEARWPSMDALVGDIEARLGRPTRRRAGYVIGGVVAAMAIGGAAAGLAMQGSAGSSTNKSSMALVTAAPDAGGRSEIDPPVPAKLDTVAPAAQKKDAAKPLVSMQACPDQLAFADANLAVFRVPGPTGQRVFSISMQGGGSRPFAIDTEALSRPQRGRRDGEIIGLARPHGGTETHVAVIDLASSTTMLHRAPQALGTVAIDDEIYYFDHAGTALVPLTGRSSQALPTFEPGALGAVAFEPRTRVLAYVGSKGGPVCYRALSSDASRCGQRHVPAQRPAFSADGEQLFVGDANGVWRIDLARGEESLIAEGDASGGVAVSPDGARLMWASCQRVARVTRLTGDPVERQIAKDSHVVGVFAGGGSLAWINDGPKGRDLVTRRTQWETRHPVVGEISGVAIDPTGTRVAVTMENGEPGIHLYNVESAGDVFLVTGNKDDREPFWLDEKTILFHRVDRRGNYSVHTMRLDPLGRPGVTRDIARSRRVLAMNTDTGEALIALPQKTGAPLSWWNPITGRVRPLAIVVPDHISRVSISPGGRWLLLQSELADNVIYRARLPEEELQVLHPQDPFYPEVDRRIGPAIIDDSGDIIAAPAYTTGELFVMPINSAK